jgi:F-type H+-transporting ATPase subunit gamma
VFRTVRDMEYVDIHPVGKRAFTRYSPEPEGNLEDDEEPSYQSSEYYTYEEAEAEAKLCCEDFLAGRIDRVGIVYNRYVSIISQVPDVFWILPMERGTERCVDTGVFEPSPDELFENIVLKYFAAKLYALVKESFACEVAARRMAMDSAKKNAQQMIDDLTLEYNRARQGAITQEITEIVAGAGK